jgi:antitoxin component YwqK of YwqJK toxin-antitoxin module
MSDGVLNIVEVTDENGRIKCRFARTRSTDGQWIRHGRFVSYHPNGQVESEGTYDMGLEEGLWCDYYPNGVMAAQGSYKRGKEHGLWRFWSQDGNLQEETAYRDGQQVVTSRPN